MNLISIAQVTPIKGNGPVRRIFDFTKFQEVARRGLENGARMRSATTLEWNLAPKCESPVYREMTARPRPDGMVGLATDVRGVKVAHSDRRDIEFDTRCRKCPPCLKQRAAYWRFRAQNETSCAPRTWFVTLTLSPESQFQMLLRASLRLQARGDEFDSLPPERQFVERHAEAGKEITLWLKRVRKEAAVPLRYCLVAEAHKSGLPHYHLLVHEVRADCQVPARVLRSQWKLGFSQCKLVAQGDEAKSSAYVAKYLAKSALARIRASRGYGDETAQAKSILDHSFNSKLKREPSLTPPAKHELEKERAAALERFFHEAFSTERSCFVDRDTLVDGAGSYRTATEGWGINGKGGLK